MNIATDRSDGVRAWLSPQLASQHLGHHAKAKHDGVFGGTFDTRRGDEHGSGSFWKVGGTVEEGRERIKGAKSWAEPAIRAAFERVPFRRSGTARRRVAPHSDPTPKAAPTAERDGR